MKKSALSDELPAAMYLPCVAWASNLARGGLCAPRHGHQYMPIPHSRFRKMGYLPGVGVGVSGITKRLLTALPSHADNCRGPSVASSVFLLPGWHVASAGRRRGLGRQ